MVDDLTLLGLGILAYAATNIDNLVVLVAFFSDRRFRPRQIVGGQFLGLSLLILVSLVGSRLSLTVASPYVGLCGLVPLAIGLRQLWLALSGKPSLAPPWQLAFRSNVLTVAAVAMANGADNVGTYIPFFAAISLPERAAIVVLFLVLTGIWCAGAALLVRHRRTKASVFRYGQRSLPWVLIGLGFYIMGRTHLLALL